eukprot:Rhum_TRINITY_DN7456_c0_g1::Rhum_TRINITY_DN7456_c0_g1_i1::g.23212::m.23212
MARQVDDALVVRAEHALVPGRVVREALLHLRQRVHARRTQVREAVAQRHVVHAVREVVQGLLHPRVRQRKRRLADGDVAVQAACDRAPLVARPDDACDLCHQLLPARLVHERRCVRGVLRADRLLHRHDHLDAALVVRGVVHRVLQQHAHLLREEAVHRVDGHVAAVEGADAQVARRRRCHGGHHAAEAAAHAAEALRAQRLPHLGVRVALLDLAEARVEEVCEGAVADLDAGLSLQQQLGGHLLRHRVGARHAHHGAALRVDDAGHDAGALQDLGHGARLAGVGHVLAVLKLDIILARVHDVQDDEQTVERDVRDLVDKLHHVDPHSVGFAVLPQHELQRLALALAVRRDADTRRQVHKAVHPLGGVGLLPRLLVVLALLQRAQQVREVQARGRDAALVAALVRLVVVQRKGAVVQLAEGLRHVAGVGGAARVALLVAGRHRVVDAEEDADVRLAGHLLVLGEDLLRRQRRRVLLRVRVGVLLVGVTLHRRCDGVFAAHLHGRVALGGGVVEVPLRLPELSGLAAVLLQLLRRVQHLSPGVPEDRKGNAHHHDKGDADDRPEGRQESSCQRQGLLHALHRLQQACHCRNGCACVCVWVFVVLFVLCVVYLRDGLKKMCIRREEYLCVCVCVNEVQIL